MTARSGSNALERLALARRDLDRICRQLEGAEALCRRISVLEPEQAEKARRTLNEARSEFAAARLRLLRALDVLALHDERAEQARTVIAGRYGYPSAEAAFTILELTDWPAEPPAAATEAESAPLAERLAEAMRERVDNKKSAAGKMGISTKTLDRLLDGKSTKPVKRKAAEDYIRSILGAR